ncbi:MAG: hypothetical protein H0W96_12735 [Solirubrobacterales bacterium]|nr:hypothetical protein [Solirubrobacterales bacterium]
MSSSFSIGERIKRYSDGAPGVVKDTETKSGNVWVQWDSSGLTTVINARQILRASDPNRA